MDHRQHATEPEQSSAQEGSAARGLPALTDFDALACALVNNVLVRAVSGFYERMAAREVVRRPRAGAVSFVQRFESALRLKLHLHVLWLNAVGGSVWPNTARCDANGRYRCEWLAPTARWHPCDAQGRPRMQRPGRPIRRQHLSPGAYRVLVWGEHVLPAFSDAIVAIDQVAAIVVDLQRGVRTEVRLPGSIGMITVHCADGTVVREMAFELRSWVRGLQPGPHRVEYTDFAGKRHEAAFVVGAAPGETFELRQLR